MFLLFFSLRFASPFVGVINGNGNGNGGGEGGMAAEEGKDDECGTVVVLS